MTLAACEVAPGPTPDTKTNLLVLRGKVQDLTGRSLERLRAIADYLALGNLHEVDILGQYWAKDKPIVHGKPGRDFLGDGFDMVVIAKGESGAAVRAWARQWTHVVDIDSDEAKSIAPVPSPQAVAEDTPTFLVFERRAGVTTPEQVLAAPSPQVYIASHHVLVNDRNRQILVVRAPSRGAVIRWVQQWGKRQAVEILALTDLASQLERCYLSPTCQPEAVALPAPALAPKGIQVSTYYPDGLLLTEDQKLGAYYLRHRATGRFLSIDGSPKVVTVAKPVTLDKWNFTRGTGLSFGKYYLQHQGTGLYLNSDEQKNVSSSSSPQSWTSGLTIDQGYSPMFGDDSIGALTADSSGNVSSNTSDGDPNWEQWDNYNNPPSATEQMLLDIISTTTHDAPWPEDSYSGDLLDAYNGILELLNGQAPKNGNVDTATLVKAQDKAEQKFGGRLPPAWATVFEHLLTEASFFKHLETWYGDGGHVQTLLTEMTINNLSLISKVQDMAKPPSGTGLNFLLAALVAAIAIAAAAAVPPPAGPVVGAVIASAWRLYSATGGADDTLSTTFANLETNLSTTFNALITQREDARSAIAGNWGKLSSFGGMVASGTLVWPKDTTAARAAASQQFEISVWQSVLNAIWTIDGSGSSSEDQDRPDVSDYLGDPWVYIIQIPVQYKKNGNVLDGWATSVNYIPSSWGPDSLPQHLFDDKAGLGISMTDFYVGKNGWAMSEGY